MQDATGLIELKRARAACRSHFVNVGFFSIFVNLLMLTGPLFMLQVYDRVLTSRSEATLVALLILVTVLFFFMGVLDYLRGRVLARAGARFQTLLDNRVYDAVMQRSLVPQERARPNESSRDLDAIRQLLAGPAPFALFDVPWVPIYLGAIFLFHPLLGWTSLAGGVILVIFTVINQYRSRGPTEESARATGAAESLGEQLRQNAEAVRGLGMLGTGRRRWGALREQALQTQLVASDRTAGFSAASKSMRFYLQSVILAVGAWLVLQQEVSPGMMIAASILMGRALAPIDQAISQWGLVQRATSGWKRLGEVLEKIPPEAEKTRLPVPKGRVEVKGLAVIAPGERAPALRNISFLLEPGQALGVIGPSGAGKTTLAKVLVGVWPPAAGSVRIDGAALDQWRSDDLGQHIGYLPQEIGLLFGTVAQNIARLSLEPDDRKVVEAAQRAGAHELLLSLPQGYDTEIGAGGQRLSGGQRQRVALARALYGDPPVVILDEPNANLDAHGEQALVNSIMETKARGKTVIIMAHRPSAIAACDLLLLIDKGQQVDLGPRDEVLKRRTANAAQLVAGGEQARQKSRDGLAKVGAATSASGAVRQGAPATGATGKPVTASLGTPVGASMKPMRPVAAAVAAAAAPRAVTAERPALVEEAQETPEAAPATAAETPAEPPAAEAAAAAPLRAGTAPGRAAPDATAATAATGGEDDAPGIRSIFRPTRERGADDGGEGDRGGPGDGAADGGGAPLVLGPDSEVSADGAAGDAEEKPSAGARREPT